MLTEAQTAKLHESIDASRRPGRLAYVVAGEPCCFIGQLAVREGLSIDILSLWDNSSPAVEERLRSLPDPFAEYPVKLLVDLQKLWDTCREPTAAKAREDMHQMVVTAAASPV